MKKEKWNIPPIYESPVMEHFFVLKGKNKETLRFFTTPEYALYLGNCGVQKDPELNSTFKKAEKLFELYDFTKREAAIASAFFELGSNLNKVYSYPDVQELEQRKQKNKNKGRKSVV